MRLFLLLLAMMVCRSAAAQWKPPEKPDPHAILNEARADKEARRYDVALAKPVWFFDHALEHEEALYGVRLSFALADWEELGNAYPPAMAKLKEYRDRARKDVEEGKNAFESFHDMVGINRVLKDEAGTHEVFAALDEKKPDEARRVYDIAQPALVKVKAYKLCGKYLSPEAELASAREQYKHLKEFSEKQTGFAQASLLASAKQTFTQDVGTLIALLVLNDRRDEAEQIAKTVRAESDDVFLSKAIDKALKGTVPRP